MAKLKVLAFYKFATIKNPKKYSSELQKACKELGIKGRILVGKEGINGGISGTAKQTSEFKKHLQGDAKFKDMLFKEDMCVAHPFTRMNVKVRKEIVALGKEVDLNKTGTRLTPKQFLKITQNPDENTIVIDTRNDYEWKVGKFKNARTFPIKTFREFPKIVDQLKDKKDKNIVMYCTGGIRCEKASAYMKQQGFKNVSQLDGGILNFCKQLPDTIWEGLCFVFDKRLVTHVNKKNQMLTKCESCNTACDLYKNCRHVDCDRYVILCESCDRSLSGCCSQECANAWKSQRTASFKSIPTQ